MPTFIGIWIETADKDHTKVTVVTKRIIAHPSVKNLTESEFQNLFTKGAEILTSGKPLPAELPQ